MRKCQNAKMQKTQKCENAKIRKYENAHTPMLFSPEIGRSLPEFLPPHPSVQPTAFVLR